MTHRQVRLGGGATGTGADDKTSTRETLETKQEVILQNKTATRILTNSVGQVGQQRLLGSSDLLGVFSHFKRFLITEKCLLLSQL